MIITVTVVIVIETEVEVVIITAVIILIHTTQNDSWRLGRLDSGGDWSSFFLGILGL